MTRFQKLGLVFMLLFVAGTVQGCAKASSVDKLWDALTLESNRNDDQDIKLSRIEQDVITLSFPEELLFKTGSATVEPFGTRELARTAKILKKYPSVKVLVAGHTDSVGSEMLNQQLSEKRARAVADILYESGLAEGQIVTVGFGEQQPVASNKTASGRKLNRRVEVTIAPATEPSTDA